MKAPDALDRGVISHPGHSTIAQALRYADRRLREAGLENAALEAARLLALVLDIPRASLVLDRDRRMDAASCLRLDALLDRRIGGEPLQHIEGTVQFREIVLRSDGRALIPRPETEQLVELITGWAGSRSPPAGVTRHGDVPGPTIARVLDIGTGSGAIALSLLAEGTAGRALGLDISRRALALARENRRRIGMEDRFSLLKCGREPYAALAARPAFDAIVSNPPYVETDAIDGLPTEVRGHDPREALDGGPDGLAVIRRIAAGARERLLDGGRIFLEIGAGQAESVAELLERAGPWRRLSVRRDLAGRDRFVTAER
ncbi:MAG: peptide chain release factor N(5)-glutamine methyltransferase [Gemmatimonadota bacterium]